jgi:hypothetical protein
MTRKRVRRLWRNDERHQRKLTRWLVAMSVVLAVVLLLPFAHIDAGALTTTSRMLSGRQVVSASRQPLIPFSHQRSPIISLDVIGDFIGSPLTFGGQVPANTSVHAVATVTVVSSNPRKRPSPSGRFTYKFFTNGTCSGRATMAQTVRLHPDGTVPPSNSTSGLTSGIYAFRAKYHGDSRYRPSLSQCIPFVAAVVGLPVTGAGLGITTGSLGATGVVNTPPTGAADWNAFMLAAALIVVGIALVGAALRLKTSDTSIQRIGSVKRRAAHRHRIIWKPGFPRNAGNGRRQVIKWMAQRVRLRSPPFPSALVDASGGGRVLLQAARLPTRFSAVRLRQSYAPP